MVLQEKLVLAEASGQPEVLSHSHQVVHHASRVSGTDKHDVVNSVAHDGAPNGGLVMNQLLQAFNANRLFCL